MMVSKTETEFIEFNTNGKWNQVFESLKNEASLTSLDEDFTTKRAKALDNQHKNRYKDVSPYDHSRVKLCGENDYINASLIEVPEANRKYILTQGPLEHTMGDFWQMTWEQGTRAIVMLNRVVEKGTLKCSQYWPLGADYGYDQDMYFEEYSLRVTLLSEQDFQHFTVRTLELKNMESGDRREVLHFHYTTWPDFGVPSSPNAFLYFLHSVRQTKSLEADVGPAIVHCSAGIGRSGTFCLVDSCLVMVETAGTLDCVDVRKSLLEMRSFRMGLIQTADQLRFSYLAIIEGAHAVLSESGLGSVQTTHHSYDENNIESQPPQPPERTTSLHPSYSPFSNVLTISNGADEEPPLLPPKKSPVSRQPDYNGFGAELSLNPGDEVKQSPPEEDNDTKDFTRRRQLGRSDNENKNCDGGEDTDEEISAADIRHQIREDRKKQTMEKIRQMKKKQRKSERWREYRPYIRHSIYFGLAIAVGVAAFVISRYLL